MTLTVKDHLCHSLADRDSGAGKSAGLDLPVKVVGGDAGEPFTFELLGLGELGSEGGVGLGNALLLFIDKWLTESEE
jgi:hypothetical protein